MVLRRLWKAGLGLLVVAPATAYVLGSLASSSADEPAPRPPILIQAPARTASSPAGDQPSAPAPTGSSERPVGEVELELDDLDDDRDDWGRDDEVDERDDHGSDDGQDDGQDDSGSDDSGHGGGGDD